MSQVANNIILTIIDSNNHESSHTTSA